MTGKHHSEETKRKISLTKKGKPSPHKGKSNPKGSIAKTGTRNPMYGTKQSKETIEKRFKNIRGENHYNWQGGITPVSRKLRVARLKATGGSHTLGEWNNLKVQYNFTCPACKKQEPDIKLTKDHIIPVIKGGSGNIENIQPLCGSCNSSKHQKIIKYEI